MYRRVIHDFPVGIILPLHHIYSFIHSFSIIVWHNGPISHRTTRGAQSHLTARIRKNKIKVKMYVCVCVCVCVCVYTYIYIYIYRNIYVFTFILFFLILAVRCD